MASIFGVGGAVIIGGGLIMLYSLSNRKWFLGLIGFLVAVGGFLLTDFSFLA